MKLPGRGGGRGEYWVAVQIILMAGYVFLPPLALPAPPGGPLGDFLRLAFSATLAAIGLALGGLGVKALGPSLTALPRPKEDGELVRSGVYTLVRHPVYAGVILLACAWAFFRWSGSHLAGALLLLVFLDAKSRREEAWLRAKYPEYADYASRVKKLIPYVY